MARSAAPDRELRIPFTTLLKVALFALLVVSVIKLWPVIIMITVSVLLAVMLAPAVDWMDRHRVPRAGGIAVVAVLLFGLLALFLFVIVPAMGRQVKELTATLPKVAQQIGTRFPSAAVLMQSAREPMTMQELRGWLERGFVAARYGVEALTAVILILVIAVYLLVEGKQVYEWLVSFAPAKQRGKWGRTAEEVRQVILAYMRGQAITCFLCGGVALTTLTLLRVPAALPLAVLAFFCDLIPVVGTIIMTVPAVLMALLAGPVPAAIVFAVYMAYHLVESYWIIPRVYGGQMRLSTLTVLLAITIGGTLQGAVGAVLILPFAAAYPIVERIWLRDRLPEDTVERHEKLEKDEG